MFTIINCNARSLCPKIGFLIDCMEETDASVGVVTETWLDDEVEEIQERLRKRMGWGSWPGIGVRRQQTESVTEG